MRIREILAAIALLAGPARSEDAIDYRTQIKPIFQARCYACHGALKQKGGLRLDTAKSAIRGGREPAIKPGEADASPLIDRVSADEDDPTRMPPEGEPLKPAEVEALRAWIAGGAKSHSDEQPERDPRDHWAFRPPIRPALPSVEHPGWARNPIDAFIAAGHQGRELTPQRSADKRVWLRRVTLDLVGLPPTREELDAFVADDSDGAEDRVVTRLLDSPRYGERWGRHWMDIWRYSDWWGLGAEVRNSQKHIWHWRDWIIESLNADKGYDQMLREMLAADELYPDDLDKLRASGFLARQYFKFNRTTWLDETVEHTSKAMLGLTFNCAKCHDHKYDPISQVDYYRMRAIFEPYQIRTDMVPGELDLEKDGIPRAFDAHPEARTFLHIRGDERRPDESRTIEPATPAFLTLAPAMIKPVSLPPEASHPGLRPFVLAAHLEVADRRIAEANRAVVAATAGLTEAEQVVFSAPFAIDPPGAVPPDNLRTIGRARLAVVVAEKALATAEAQRASIEARAAADRARHRPTPPAHLPALVVEAARLEKLAVAAKANENASRAELDQFQAKPEKKAEFAKKFEAARAALEVARKAVATPGDSYTPLPGSRKTLESNLETEESRGKPFPRVSTGRRSALARWITDPKHPLTARVAVNHLWSRHFGRPLVPTVFDFGRKGTPPTHPELLDWLAVELVEHGWSMKHIHRLIVTSNTYRLTSSNLGVAERTLAVDPENAFYWRANPIRMESEVIRDSLLHLAGELDTTQGGPSIPVADASSRRRSLYFVHSHNEHQEFLATFDDASVLECYRRADSIVPQQALALENSPLATSTAEKVARRIEAAHPGASDRDFAHDAFLAVLAVEPTGPEQAAVLDALAAFAEASRRAGRPDPSTRARVGLVHVLLNHNDFVTIR
jgi:mono/diheme cytochrome c family protein